MAAVAARWFQGVARTGRLSDPPLASKNGPRGAGPGTAPCTCLEDPGSALAPPLGRECLGPTQDFVHWNASGQLRDRIYLVSVRYLGRQYGCYCTHWKPSWHIFGLMSLVFPGSWP